MSRPETERNKDIFRRFTDGMNTNDAEIISRTIDELVEPEAVIRTPLHALGEAVAADGRADG